MKNIRQIIQKSISDVKKPQVETMKQLQKGTRLLNGFELPNKECKI